MKKGKFVLQGKKVFGLFLMCLVLSTVVGFDADMIEVKADNVFDHAVDWEPLKVMDLEGDVYYRITLTESDEIHFNDAYLSDIEVYNDVGNFIEPDGDERDGRYSNWYKLGKGNYYIRWRKDYKTEGKRSGAWYYLKNNYEQTDLTKDSNTAGTIFEGYHVWEPMNTTSLESRTVLKIVLQERSAVELRFDDHDLLAPSDGYDISLYDFHGRKIEDLDGVAQNHKVVEWDEGTYFVRTYGYRNLYYRLSAPQNATGITISSNKVSLSVGEKKKLTSKIEPSNCIDTVSWKSTDTNVATVKNDGTITGVSAGTCVVQATTGSGKAALCEVTVTASKSSGTKSNSASKTRKTMKLSNVKIKKGSKKITGKVSVKNTTVKVKIGSGKYKKAKVKGKKFTLKTKKLKKGKKITIKVTKSGYKSLTKKYKVR